jgi:hypothetical protein
MVSLKFADLISRLAGLACKGGTESDYEAIGIGLFEWHGGNNEYDKECLFLSIFR